MNSKEKIEQIIAKCIEEIEWAQANMDEIFEIGGYQELDEVWLPHWLRAHNKILEIAND